MLLERTKKYNEGAAYFAPGDVVVLKQELDNKPVMVVKTVDKMADASEKPRLVGITCQWFNTSKELQTARFSTKDLVKVNDKED